MTLIESIMVPCRLMHVVTEDDPYGSTIPISAWTEGASFDAAIIKNSTTEAIVAEKQGITEIFTVVPKKGFVLDYHQVFKRVSDGQIFRVTSNIKDSEAPDASSVKIGKVTAEKWVLT